MYVLDIRDTDIDGISHGSDPVPHESDAATTSADMYAFQGIHQIYDFDAPNSGVSLLFSSLALRLTIYFIATIVRFAHNQASLIACGSSSGKLTIKNLSEPPDKCFTIEAHTKAITGHFLSPLFLLVWLFVPESYFR